MYELRVRDHIDAAHYIEGYVGKCSRLHGHRWDIEVEFIGGKLGPLNMLVDFKIIKQVLSHLLEQLDHYPLNERLKEKCVTAEYLAKWLFEKLPASIDYVELRSVTVWESPDCSVTYKVEE